MSASYPNRGLLNLIGHIVLQWGLAENRITMDIMNLNTVIPPDEKVDDRFKTELKQWARYHKKAFPNIPESRVDKIADLARSCATRRNDLVHLVWNGEVTDGGEGFVLQEIKIVARSGATMQMQFGPSRSFTRESLQALLDEIVKLRTDIATLIKERHQQQSQRT
jgi:hypothetical protein